MSSSNTFFSESHVTRSFRVHPSETSCLCPSWNWQVQVLRGVIAIRSVHQCQPTGVLWLQRNSSDCVWTMSWVGRAVIRNIYMVFREYLSNSWHSHGFQWVFELCVVGAKFVKFELFVRVCLNFLCWVYWVQSWSRWCSQCSGSCDGGCSRTSFLSEATSQCHIFGWCFWFVWLVCWSVCYVIGDVGNEFIWQSCVAEWRDEIFFVSSLCAVFSVWEWQVQQSVCEMLFVLVQGDLKENMFFALKTSGSFDSFCRLCGGLLHEVSWRCDVFLLVQRGHGSTNQISDFRLLLIKFFIRRDFSK